LTKETLKRYVAEKTGLTLKQSEEVITSVLQGIMEGTIEDGICSFTGFGKFEVKPTAARKGYNMQTGEPIEIPAGKKLKFTPFGIFKNSVKGN